MSNIITATFDEGCVTTITKELWQWDYGQILQFPDLDLPESYEVHFGNTVVGLAPIQIGNADGVQIPDILLAQPEAITAWVFLHVGDSDGETRYQVTIPVIPRAKPFTGDVPPVQQSAITQAISLLNSAVDNAEESATAASQSATDAAGSASSASASAMQANRSATQASSAAAGAASSASIAGQQASISTSRAEAAAASATAAADSAADAAGSASSAAQTLVDVNAAGAEQITAIDAEGSTQIAAVTAEGQRVLESIPEDYTDLSDEVSNLKSAAVEYGQYVIDYRFNGTKYTAGNAKYYLVCTIANDCAIKRVIWSGQQNTPSLAVVRGNTVMGVYPLAANDGTYKTADVHIPCKSGDMVFVGGSARSVYEKTVSAEVVEKEKEFPGTGVSIGSTVTVTENNVYLQWDVALYAIDIDGILTQPLLTVGDYQLSIDNNALKYVETDNEIEYLGRWFDRVVGADTVQAANTDGAEILFSVIGATYVTLTFDTWKKETGNEPYIVYSVDGAEFVRTQITSAITITLPDTLWHSVRVMLDGMPEKITSRSANKWNGMLWVCLRSYETDGTMRGLRPVNRIGVFFGDSVTEGVCCLGDTSTSANNSASHAYPYYCAKKLNAVPYYVAYGASGLTNKGSFHPAIDAVDYDYANVPTEYIKADFVVINHGINDYSQTPEAFGTAYQELINAIKRKYPGVPIFLVRSFSETISKFSATMKTLADSNNKCYFIDTFGWDGATTDGTHLSPAGAQSNGEKLADIIISVLGKAFFE